MSGNWVFVEKERRGGPGNSRYSEYHNKPVVVTTPNGEILLTPCVMEMLGHPRFVSLMIDPVKRMFAITPSDGTDLWVARKIQYVRSGKDRVTPPAAANSQMARVSARGFTEANSLTAEGNCFVWTIQEQEGLLVVDMKQRREVIAYGRKGKRKK